MNKKLKFVWIDDDSTRKKSADHLEKQLGVSCLFIDVKPKDADYMTVINEEEPDLILVDHNLTEIGTGEIKKGSTIAALIREKHPTYAIVCITGQEKNNINSQQQLSYEDVFSYDDMKNHLLTIKSIAISFRKLKATPPKNIKELIKLLNVPNEEITRLETILPHEVKENLQNSGIFSILSHWIRNILLDRPGFLYDRLWAATFLGLNENGFSKVEHLFLSAKYDGIFADESRERWWKSKLLKILSAHVKTTGLPWEKGRFLDPKFTNRYFSKDYYSNFKEEYPEVVAYIDETTNQRAQMKLKHTVLHPKYDKLLFFEEIRMMKAD